ncbi:MAG: hypothetical protein AB7U82_22120 [Blastocatellales bacterium]
MKEDLKSDSSPEPMPAPQLPNIPISPDDPFQQDPDQLPPVSMPPDSDPAPNRQSPRTWPGSPSRRYDPNEPEEPEAA